MTESFTCPVCTRQDPVTVLDSACMANGQFKPACLLCKHQLSAPDTRNLGQVAGDVKPSDRSPTGQLRRVLDFLKTHIPGSAQSSAFLSNAVTDIEARITRTKRLWQVIAAAGTLVGGASGLWFRSGHPTPTPTPTEAAVKGPAAATPNLDQNQKTQFQLELAQGCLDSGILECASHLVEPVVHADTHNAVANKIKADLVIRQAMAASSAMPVTQEQKALLSLAAADLQYGTACLTRNNLACATTLASLVLQSIPNDYLPGQQMRRDAESLQDQASATAPNRDVAKPQPPKVMIK